MHCDPNSVVIDQIQTCLGLGGRLKAEMTIGDFRCYTAARRTHDITLLDEVRFQDIFDGVALFADSRRQAVQTDRPAAEFFHDGAQQARIHMIETARIHVQHAHGGVGDLGIDFAVGFHLCEIPNPAQQAIGNPGRTARAPRDFHRPAFVHLHIENSRRPGHDVARSATA